MKPVRGGNVPVIGPRRVGLDVDDDEGLLPTSGRARRTRIGSDAQPVNGLAVGSQQALRSVSPRVFPRSIKQQGGADDLLNWDSTR